MSLNKSHVPFSFSLSCCTRPEHPVNESANNHQTQIILSITFNNMFMETRSVFQPSVHRGAAERPVNTTVTYYHLLK